MAKPLSRIRDIWEKECLSINLILFAVMLNLWAWIIPRGDFRHPARDPLLAAQYMSETIKDGQWLAYFWNACLAITVYLIGYSAYKICRLGIVTIKDRIDL